MIECAWCWKLIRPQNVIQMTRTITYVIDGKMRNKQITSLPFCSEDHVTMWFGP